MKSTWVTEHGIPKTLAKKRKFPHNFLDAQSRYQHRTQYNSNLYTNLPVDNRTDTIITDAESNDDNFGNSGFHDHLLQETRGASGMHPIFGKLVGIVY